MDCADADAAISFAASEVWYDGIDQNCDPTDEYDADGDGYDSDAHSGADCDDADDAVNPGEDEVCNDGIDNDCSGDAPECGVPESGSISDADLSFTSTTTGDTAGEAVATGADLDGDGLQDLVMGVPDGAPGGALYVLYGGTSGAVTTSSADASVSDSGATGSFGATLAAVPDLDGDGYDELLIQCEACEPTGVGTDIGGVHLMLGPISGSLAATDADATWTGSANYSGFGSGLDAMADFTGDGVPDFLMGAVDATTAYLVAGSVSGGGDITTAASTTFSGTSLDAVGGDVASGDFDGDGSADALIGAPGLDAVASNGGGVYLAYGPLSSAVDLTTGITVSGRSTNAEFGATLAVGELDGDGKDDLALGANYAGPLSAGAVYAFHGPVTAGTLDVASADGTISGTNSYSELGSRLSVGDTDGDGVDDLHISQSYYNGKGFQDGQVLVFPGGAE
jgi:hypothetical protein